MEAMWPVNEEHTVEYRKSPPAAWAQFYNLMPHCA